MVTIKKAYQLVVGDVIIHQETRVTVKHIIRGRANMYVKLSLNENAHWNTKIKSNSDVRVYNESA